jgi:hypothetical protein
MDNEDSNDKKEERNLFVRISCCVLWFIPFFLVTNILTEIVVAAIAGLRTGGTFQEGAAVGQSAVTDFFQENYLFIFAFQLLAYWGLCLLHWVPGVSKYKRTKRP